MLLKGQAPGVANAGTLSSGRAERRSGITGWYNTSTLGAGGGGLRHRQPRPLSGFLANGTVLSRSPIVNIGWADVGAFNTGLGNVGTSAGCGGIGAQNLGLGNLGGNVGFGIGAGSVSSPTRRSGGGPGRPGAAWG